MQSAIGPEVARRGKILYLGAPIKLVSETLLSGCNRYHATSVIHQRLSFGILTHATTEVAGPGFANAFLDRFSAPRSFRPRNGISAEFVEQLSSPEGTDFGDVLLEAVLALENALAFARHDLDTVDFAAIERHDRYTDLVWGCTIPKLSRGAARVALIGVLDLLPPSLYSRPRDGATDFDAAWRELRDLARRRRLSPATAVLKQAAKRRGLACATAGRQHLRLGLGSAQHQLYSSMTATTSITAQKVCADKRLTNRRLAELRLPVPRQIKVGSLRAAREAAAKMGFPIVIKPVKGKKGGGVTAGLTAPEGVGPAFERAHKLGKDVLVEEFLPGADHRLLVIGGKFAAALIRHPPSITGDGESSVGQLIDQLNAHPYRDGFRLFAVQRDDEVERMLRDAGVTFEDVLVKGQTIALRSTANVSTGGVPIDVTDQVHPDNREMAERVALGVGLDVAGVDYITTDISRSFRETGGGIIEVNARPGLDIHIWPLEGQPRDVAGEVLKLSFPPGTDGRIPIVTVAGDKGTGATARILDGILRGANNCVALALRTRAFVDGESAELTRAQQARAASLMLRDPQVDMLVGTVSLRQVVRRGLLLEQCALSVIMDKVREEETELFHEGIEILARATTDCFVVGAGNRIALDRLGGLGSRRLILISENPNDAALKAHLGAGNVAVTRMWRDTEIRTVLLRGNECLAAFDAEFGALRDDSTRTRRMKRAAMFAIGAAFGIGLSPEEITQAMESAPAIVPDTSGAP